MIGKTIGKYRFVGQLGRGGMGTVYKAVDDTLDREVAVKVLNPGLAETQIARFRKEAITVAKLNHPEIATIYELFRAESDLLMVMEYVRGETLDRIAQRVGTLPPEHAAHLIDRVLSALGHAHGAGIVHCDMKPANLMVTTDGDFKIMDFGIARVRGADHITVDGHMMGTPAYMPPEQVLGQDVDARSDLYSVGIILYRVLTGALPFRAETAIAMVQQQISAVPMPLATHREGLPAWCEPILRRALAKNPGDRFQTAKEFRHTLEQAVGVLKPEVERAFFSSIVDLEATPPSQPGELERFGSTRVWAADAGPSTTHAEVRTRVPAAGDATLVLPRRAGFIGSLLVVLAVAGAALMIGGPWRTGVAPPGATRGAPIPAIEDAPPSNPERGRVAVVENATSPAAAPETPRAAPVGDAPESAAAEATRATPGDNPQFPAPEEGRAVPVEKGPPPMPAAIQAAPVEKTPSTGPQAARTAPVEHVPSSTPDVARTAPIEDAPSPSPEAAAAAAPAVTAPPAVATPEPLPGGAVVAAPASRANAVPYVFEARALIQEGDRARERESQVFLVDGRINVKANDDQSLLYSLPASGVLSISYSQGRDPLWNGPDGPTRVTRAGGGLGIFRGTRHWVSLRLGNADAAFVVFRLGSGERAKDAIAALEARTGRRTAMLVENPQDN